MREGTQCFGRMEGLLGPDRLSEALRGKIQVATVSGFVYLPIAMFGRAKDNKSKE